MDEQSESKGLDELLFHYVGLKAQIRALQHEMRGIYPTILEQMQGSEEKREVGGAIVSYRTRKKYKFSETIRILREELKLLKRHEIDNGIAEVESETGMIFVRFKRNEEQFD